MSPPTSPPPYDMHPSDEMAEQPYDLPPPEEMPESTPEPRTICFRLFREGVAQFAIEYKDKDDLYRSFMKKLDELNIPRRKMYFVGAYEDHYEINHPDTLLGLALDNHVVKVNVCPEDDHTDSCSDDSELNHESIEEKRDTKGQKCTRSKNCGRSHKHHHFSGHPHFRDHLFHRYSSSGCPWHFPGFHPGPSSHYHSYYEPPPHDHYMKRPPFNAFMPFYPNADPRLHHCPFFRMTYAPGNYPCSGWQDGYYGY